MSKLVCINCNLTLNQNNISSYLVLMIPEYQAKIQQSISLLQEVLGKTSLNTQPTHTPTTQPNKQVDTFPQFDQNFLLFVNKGQEIGGQIAQLTSAAANMFNIMSNFVKYSKTCKQPDEATSKKVQQLLKAKAAPIISLENDEQWKYHAKSVKQMINATFWIFTPSPQIVLQGAIQASEFNANKFRVNKVLPINEWYSFLINSVKLLKKEVLAVHPTGLSYNFNGTGSWNDLLSGSTPPSQQVQPVKQATTSNVEQKPVSVQQPVKKAPIKQSRQGNWFVQNHEGQIIEFSAEQCQMRTAMFIENCNKCVIKIEKSKIKSVMISRSQNLTVIVKDCVSGVQIMNSKDIRVQVLGLSHSISIDKSQKIHIILNGQNKGTDIVSSKVAQLNISYTTNQQQDLAKDHPVPEQIVTKWNDKTNKFESIVYDKFM